MTDSMVSPRKTGAGVLLLLGTRVVMQLRDDLFQWGIFGGLAEEGEDPRSTALREIAEELTVTLDPGRLSLLRIFENDAYVTHLFIYPLQSELSSAVLTEGVRFDTFGEGDLKPEEVVPWHMHMLEWYWNQHGKPPRSPRL